ncbi:hypothetical protein FHT92_005108 [Rhizobium sp. BK377]|nr:hypothetical protein [Rhizobium sp. BK377]
MATTPRRPVNPLDAAEALFKPTKKTAAAAVERRPVPVATETVSIGSMVMSLPFSRKTARVGKSASTQRCGRPWSAKANRASSSLAWQRLHPQSPCLRARGRAFQLHLLRGVGEMTAIGKLRFSL